MRASRAWLPLVAVGWLTPTLLWAQARLPKHFDAEVTRALARFQVPGAVIAVVREDRVLLLRGYGVRRVGDPSTISPHTLFQIGSNTKAFTAAALALLVDSGRLRWDGPVTNYLPGFELADPWVTRQLTVRDLLTHRSGLGVGAGDLLWFHSTLSRQEILYRIRAAHPVTSFRSGYAYDNVLYGVAGEIVPSLTRTSWEAFVHTRLLLPLGMTETRTGIADLQPGDTLATGYALADDGHLQVVPLDTVDNIAPAAAISSTGADLVKWVQVQLDSGRVGGTTLWSLAAAREMWTPQTVIPIDDPEPPLAALRPNFFDYALGWRLRDYHGRKIVWHTGGLAGMTSRITLVPEERLGIVVLTNGESDLPDALTYDLLDHFLKVPPTDWVSAFADVADHDRAAADSEVTASRLRRDSTSRPTLPLARYVGVYRDSLYGDATVALEHGALVFRFSRSPAFTGELEHWQYDTFITRWHALNLAAAFLTFDLTPEGTVAGIRMAAVSPLADFSFDYQDLHFLPVRSASAP
jgi:CubicO group peptidase (beta-lactamase class C family)